MVEEHDRFMPIYEETRKLFEEGLEKDGSARVMVESILGMADILRISIGPNEEELFIDGLKKYFLKLGIITYESKTKSPILGKARMIFRFEREKTIKLDKDITEKLRRIKAEFPPSYPPDDKEIINDALEIYLAALHPV